MQIERYHLCCGLQMPIAYLRTWYVLHSQGFPDISQHSGTCAPRFLFRAGWLQSAECALHSLPPWRSHGSRACHTHVANEGSLWRGGRAACNNTAPRSARDASIRRLQHAKLAATARRESHASLSHSTPPCSLTGQRPDRPRRAASSGPQHRVPVVKQRARLPAVGNARQSTVNVHRTAAAAPDWEKQKAYTVAPAAWC